MIPTPQIVLFAIQAGIRLYAAGRKAYVEATLDQPLTLPLPSGPNINAASAHTFFEHDQQGKLIAARDENERIRVLLADASPDGEKELTQIYFTYQRELRPDIFERPIPSDEPKGHELVALMTIRQWSKDELSGHPTALQRIAGTLVNIAVDYFVHTPEAISDKRPTGRALKAFLEAIDGLDFAEAPPAEIAGDLLIAVVDSVGTHAELLGNTATEKKLVQNIATTLSKSARTHLDNVPTEVRWEGSAWLQMIARAVVKGSVDTVLADPNAVLGIGDVETPLVQEVGQTIADLVIGPERLRFQALFAGEGVNTIIKAALLATAKNPAILRVDNQGLRNIIVGVANGLSQQANLLTSDLLPDLARLVLEKSADNLDLVWPGGASDPANHLLITGVRQVFLALAEGTQQAGWPTLTKTQLSGIAEAILQEILENPDWVLARADFAGDSALRVAMRAVLGALQPHIGPRLSADAVAAAISAALKASAMRLELLRALPAGGADAGTVAIGAAIVAVLEQVFGSGVSAEAQWIRARHSTLVAVLEVALAALARIGAEQKHIDVLRRDIGSLVDKRLTVEQLGERLVSLLEAA